MTESKHLPIEEDGLNFAPLLEIIRRYKWLILAMTLGICLLLLAFLLISMAMPREISPMPNMYRAQAIILISDKAGVSPLGSVMNGKTLSAGGFPTSFSYGDLAVKLLKSNSLLDQIAEEFKITERKRITADAKGKSRSELLKRMTADYDDKTYTVTISFEDYDPEFCRDIVNRFVELLDKKFLSIGGNKHFTEKGLLETKIGEVKARMDMYELQIQAFQKQYGFINIEDLATEQLTLMAKLRGDYILKDIEIKTYSEFSRVNDPFVKKLITERDSLNKLLLELENGSLEHNEMLPSQKDLPVIARDFYRVKQDLTVQQKIYEILIEQYEQVKLTIDGDEPVFQVLESADVPDQKIGPERGIIFGIGSFAGIALSLFTAFAVNMLRQHFHSGEKRETGKK